MAISAEDVQIIKGKVDGLIRQRAWGVRLGEGSFITLEFGKPAPPSPEGYTHGEWHLWVCCCAWRLERSDEVIVGSDDERDDLQKAVRELEGLSLETIELIPPAGDAVFRFEGGVILRLFSYRFGGDYEHWILFTPTGKVLTLAGISWSYTDIDPPRSA